MVYTNKAKVLAKGLVLKNTKSIEWVDPKVL